MSQTPLFEGRGGRGEDDGESPSLRLCPPPPELTDGAQNYGIIVARSVRATGGGEGSQPRTVCAEAKAEAEAVYGQRYGGTARRRRKEGRSKTTQALDKVGSGREWKRKGVVGVMERRR